MLRKLYELWKDQGLMNKALRDLGEMTADAGYIHQAAWELLEDPANADNSDVKARDREVNRREREIRRLLLEHLTLNPGHDASGCLAVMSLAKDLERLGDLSKSIFSIGRRLEAPIQDIPVYAELASLHAAIASQFPKLRVAIVESNESMCNEILEDYGDIKKQAKSLTRSLYDMELTTRQAVTATLLTRVMHRQNSHQGNAATAVIYPLENIDYVSRGQQNDDD